ncbi:regulator of replication initiation timing [Fontibacillus solani]|uniref:Regulator of replication initiation timing n=1 Tax=Fontibacillus solani TaxID=1572857 RepID=A0A7W3SYH4_9BACL|nr:hypothetical protein [Fontibacillus solani]MBA9088569.1 regulator of replication initiation timing [Fontibacillus solani]
MPERTELDLSSYKELLQHGGLQDKEKAMIQELIEQVEELQAENARLRKTLLRVNAANNPRMSTKLKEALYE